ncbi:MAG: prolyl oligopeptidase family serine peptidase, partial [Acidobacteriota bacterium]|nr:prolyl oligopeptidase family serine peptidase [Acidobacteriota bacterium]
MRQAVQQRRSSRIFGALGALALAACGGPEPRISIEPHPLVPLKTFLAPQSYDAPRLSPDGSWIAYLGPLEGVSNFFVAPIDDLAAAKAITEETGHGIRVRDVSGVVMYRWSGDGRYLLFPHDNQGDENWNLFRADIETGQKTNLTKLVGSRMELVRMSLSDPRQVLVSIAESMIAPADLYSIDIETGERTLVEKNPGFAAYLSDNELRARVAIGYGAEGGMDLLTRSSGGAWEPSISIGQEDLAALSATGYQNIARFDADNRRAFFYDSRGRDTIALIAWDLEQNSIEVLAEDPRVDIGGVLYHPTRSTPQAYATNWTRTEWHALDESIRRDLDFLASQTEGEYRIVSRSADDDRWIVRFTLAHEPETYALYEREDQNLTKLFVTTPQLEGIELSRMYAEVIPSRDGLDLVSYLTYPPWIEIDDRGRPTEPVPLVMLVHGGPGDERAQYAYGPFLHWLNNRGYGVFFVNFRGSPGFGKAFVNAARMEWGGKMHEDLVDQV